MTINEEINRIANQLANEGQKPTVAKIKAKLSQPVPLPTIIGILKNWQHTPNDLPVENNQAKQEEISITIAQVEALIERRLAPLYQEIETLKRACLR